MAAGPGIGDSEGVGEALAVVAAAAAGGVVLRSLGRRREPHPELSPDGRRYLAMAAGRPAPFPFALRWLLPALCSTSLRRWRWCTALHLGALPPLVAYWLWVEGTAAVVCVAGGLMVCGLPGVWRLYLRWPVLVDPAAMAWALASAVFAEHRLWLPAVGAALIAGSMKESAPLFAACYAWHPAALVGLVAPLVRAATTRWGDDVEGDDWILDHPILASRREHKGRWFAPGLMLAPWGMCLLAGRRRPPGLADPGRDRGAGLRAGARGGEHRPALPVGVRAGHRGHRGGRAGAVGAGRPRPPPAQPVGGRRPVSVR